MKKIIFRIIAILLLLIQIFLVYFQFYADKTENYSNVTNDLISILVDEKDGNGYKRLNNTYPIGSYKLNTSLSSCTNGTPLGTYDSKTGTMTMSFNKSDKCTFFFEKLIYITMTILHHATEGSPFSYVCKVEVSNDDGKTYQTVNYSNNTGDTLTFSVGSIIRLSTLGSSDSSCDLKVCENSSCSITGSAYAGNSDADISVTYGSSGTYVVQEKDAYIIIKAGIPCLAEDTYVYYYDKKSKRKKKKKIKDVTKNDLVYVVSDEEISYKKVKKIEKNIAYDIINIYLENGEIIQSTYEHVFVANGLSYVLAKELKENFELKLVNGKYIKIVKIEKVHYNNGIEVYNLSFDGSKNACIMIANSMILSAVLLSTNVKKVIADGCVSAGEAPA